MFDTYLFYYYEFGYVVHIRMKRKTNTTVTIILNSVLSVIVVILLHGLKLMSFFILLESKINKTRLKYSKGKGNITYSQ